MILAGDTTIKNAYYRIRQNFRGYVQNTLFTAWKTFEMHQAMAIMYCTQQVIQGENFRNRLKIRENHESFAM